MSDTLRRWYGRQWNPIKSEHSYIKVWGPVGGTHHAVFDIDEEGEERSAGMVKIVPNATLENYAFSSDFASVKPKS